MRSSKAACLALALAAIMALQGAGAFADSGEQSPKGETVYVLLEDGGGVASAYVVNEFAGFPGGRFVDYGGYSEVRNLVSTDAITLRDGQVSGTAPAGRFYYEGTLISKEIPWFIGISHTLDGKPVAAQDLVGKSGHWRMEVHIASNPAFQVFSDSYVIQLSATIDAERVANLRAEDGMVANAGKNRNVTFTVLPGSDALLAVSGDVSDFEMSAVSINALPFAMSIDLDGIADLSSLDDVSGKMDELGDAVMQFRDGAQTLSDGTYELSANLRKVYSGCGELQDGFSTLRDSLYELHKGARTYQSGLGELTQKSAELRSASNKIKDAINQINDALSASGSGGAQLATASDAFLSGLTTFSGGMSGLDGMLTAYVASATAADPSLGASGGPILGTSAALKANAAAMVGSYTQIHQGILALSGSGLSGLADAVKELAAKYEDFHKGLLLFTDGILSVPGGASQIVAGIRDLGGGADAFSDGFKELAQGLDELYGGSALLYGGARKLYEGSCELADATGEFAGKPGGFKDEVQTKIDEVTGKISGGEFVAESFVSPLNRNVVSVQFVMRTNPIQRETPPKAEPDVPKTTFWDRLLALFR